MHAELLLILEFARMCPNHPAQQGTLQERPQDSHTNKTTLISTFHYLQVTVGL